MAIDLLYVADIDIEGRHDNRRREQQVVGLEKLRHAPIEPGAGDFGAADLVALERHALFDIPDKFRLEGIAPGAQEIGLHR